VQRVAVLRSVLQCSEVTRIIIWEALHSSSSKEKEAMYQYTEAVYMQCTEDM